MTAADSQTSPTQPVAADPPLASGFAPPTLAEWRGLVDKALKGADFERRLVSRTADGIPVGPLYTRADSVADDFAATDAEVARRTQASRGTAAVGTRIATLHTDQDAASMAAAIAQDIAGGAQALTIRIAAPGHCGLAADFQVIEATLADVALERVRISLAAGTKAVHAGLALAAIANARGAPQVVAGLGIDPLGVMAQTGERWLLKPDGGGFALGMPWLPAPATTLLADSRPYHEAGASEAQELAALAATLVAYLRASEAEGLAPGQALPRIALALALDADIVLGLAKLRAARRIVWRIAEACGAGEASSRMPVAVTTSERMMSKRDPWVNMLRVTAACAAAMMGRADDVTVLPFTWALGQPDAFARRIARNVGIVLAEESSLARIADPAGGAWAVEALSEKLATKAWGIFQEWETEGGMQAALVSGLVQDQIAAVAERRAKDIATGKLALTGTSAFPLLGDDGVTATSWPASPPLPDHRAARPLLARRLAEPFERLRDAADAAGARPAVFLASLGSQAEHGTRSIWTANFLAAGGVGVVAADGFTSSADAGRAFAESGAAIACICGTDETYAELAEATTMALKGAGAARVYLAGRPAGELKAALEAAGVDGFLYAGSDAIEALSRLHRELGVASTD